MKRSKNTALFLAILLGVLGVHKFYLGRTLWGMVYLFMCWTYIPMFIGFYDAYKLYKMSSDEFDELYNSQLITVEMPISTPNTPERFQQSEVPVLKEIKTKTNPPEPPVATPTLKPDVKSPSPPFPQLDINQASESELADLPGIGPILAKKAIRLRTENNGFESLEDFTQALGLRTHIKERLQELITVSPLTQIDNNPYKGRQVDY